MEILNELKTRQEQMERRLSTIEDLLKRQSNRPVSVEVDTAKLAETIKGHIGNPVASVEKAEQSIKTLVQQIPKSVSVRGEVIGFTSKRSALLYLGVLIGLLLGLSYWLWYERSEREKYHSLANSYERDYQRVSKKNPKLAERYLRALKE